MSLEEFIEKIGVNDFKWRNVKNIVGIARDKYNNEDFPAENVIYVRIEDLDKSYIGARKRITFVFANSRRTSRYNGFFNEGATEECEKCGDPACKDGEICGLKEEEKKAEKPVEEEIKLEKDLLGRTVIAEKQDRKDFYRDRIRALKRLAKTPDVSGKYVFSADVDFLNLAGTNWYNRNKDRFSKFEWKGNMLDRCNDTFAFSFDYEPTYKEITDKLAQLCKAKWGIAPYEEIEDECAVSTIGPSTRRDNMCVLTDDESIATDPIFWENGLIQRFYPVQDSADYVDYSTEYPNGNVHIVDGKSGLQNQLAEEDLDEFEPEEDGSEYYGKVMEKAAAIVDDPVCEDDDVDECDIAEMIELGKKIR